MHHAVRQSLGFNLKSHRRAKARPEHQARRVAGADQRDHDHQPDIRDLILKSKDDKLIDAIRIGYLEGMVDFAKNLKDLVDRGDIDKATALEFAPNPDQLKMMLKGISVAAPGIL